MPEKEDFDAVDWVRKHRDENYRKHEGDSLEEFARHLTERGEKSALWTRIKKRHGRSQQAA